jgi:hypothetical protein
MNKKKSIHSKELAVKNNNVFCAECGEELDMFGINGEVDQNKIKERHKRCREKGKFKGDLCSMMFISGDAELPPLSEEAD